MKMKTLLAAAAMCFVFSAAAFAQSTYTVGSTPVTQVVKSGQTEKNRRHQLHACRRFRTLR